MKDFEYNCNDYKKTKKHEQNLQRNHKHQIDKIKDHAG